MSESKEDGGPAFPVPKDTAIEPVTNMRGQDVSSGMSLRQWYAGQAVIGICLHSEAYNWSPESIAERANRIADALLKARHG